MKPAKYWRLNKQWQNYLGKMGKVIAATKIHVSTPEHQVFVPYNYVIVDFGDEKKEFMGNANGDLTVGDKVECVLRKIQEPDEKGLVTYGIKVRKIN